MIITAKTECGLTFEQVGASIRQAYHEAVGAPLESVLARWVGLASSAEPLLLKFEGAPWGEVAKEVYELFSEIIPSFVAPAWGELPGLGRLGWEAVTRQLVWLFDLSEPLTAEELARSEARWGAWARLKLAETEIAPQRRTA